MYVWWLHRWINECVKLPEHTLNKTLNISAFYCMYIIKWKKTLLVFRFPWKDLNYSFIFKCQHVQYIGFLQLFNIMMKYFRDYLKNM